MFSKSFVKPWAKQAMLGAALLATSLAASSTWAATITLSPTTTTVQVGGVVSLDLLISDLAVNQDLGAFDLQLHFDASSLQFGSYDLGTDLGVVSNFDAFDVSGGLTGTGTLHLGEVSLLSDLSSQSGAFRLATVHFIGQQVGISSLSVSDITLGDAFGGSLPVTNAAAASVTINSPIPEPSGYAIALTGVALLGFLRRRQADRG